MTVVAWNDSRCGKARRTSARDTEFVVPSVISNISGSAGTV
jgi:hypothetical protein